MAYKICKIQETTVYLKFKKIIKFLLTREYQFGIIKISQFGIFRDYQKFGEKIKRNFNI